MHRREFLRRASAAAVAAAACRLHAAEPATQPSMMVRKIPSSGELIPVVGMGTWQTFDVNPDNAGALGPLADVLRIFFDAGARVIDSSPMYGNSERVTGLLSERLGMNDKLFLATKVWTTGEARGIEQMNRSLELLRRERIELMQIHNLTDWRTQLKTLRAWKDAGRFRYIGITHYALMRFDEMEQILRAEKLDFVQLPYSIAMRAAEQRLLPAAADTGTAVLVMRPFEGGNLFASVREKPLPDFVQGFASSWAQAFLKFILANEAITCVIPATSKPQHMRDNVQAGLGRLPELDERRRLVQAIEP